MSDVQGAQESSAAENAAVAQTGDAETTARRMGWRPKDEFKGDAAKWVDAETFVAERWDDLPKLRRTVRDMETGFKRLEGQLKEQTEVFSNYRDFASRAEQRAYERARGELEAKLQVAVASADTEGFKQVQAELKQLEKDTPPGKPATAATTTTERKVDTPAEPPREITEWIAENPWFNSDLELHEAAKSLDAGLRASHPGMPYSERLAMVKERVMRNYPEKFGANARRDAPSSVANPGGATPPRKKGKTYDDLPPEAKKACDKYVKTIPPDKNGKKYTRDDYVRDYDWSDA